MTQVDHVFSVAESDDVFTNIKQQSEKLRRNLNKYAKQVFLPSDIKTLRPFTSGEVADLLGISQTHLRKLHFDGKIPDVASDSRGRKIYTSKDLYEIRIALSKHFKDPIKVLPGRRNDEPLHVIAVTTFKGGSAKTTSSNHLAIGLANRGYRVMCVDLDPQASLSTNFGIRPEINMQEESTIYDAIRYDNPVPLRKIIRKTCFENLYIAPSSLILSEFETETPKEMRRPEIATTFHSRLSNALNDIDDLFDIVVIDCPPSLGFLTINAVVAANSLLIPVVPEMIDVASLSQFLTMLTSLLDVVEESGLELNFDFIRYLLTRFEPSDTPQSQMASFLRMQFGSHVMTEPFLKSTAVSDAGMTHKTIYEMTRQETVRKTLDRALDSINAVVDEYEREIHKAWGRVV